VQQCPGPEVEEQLDVHVRGTMRVVRAAWPHLAAAGAGRVLTTGSAGAFGYGGPWGWDGTYCVAKAAMFGVTRQMAGAGEDVGIKVNMVMPWAYTDMTKAAIDGTDLANWIQAKLECGTIPAAMLYLLHRDCPVSGQFFSTGGGRVARIAFASTKGYLNPVITPEDVVENWDEIYGKSNDQGDLEGMFDVLSLSTEFEAFQRALG
jgi:NAD(P)-dependent dehydrogenase (short-subunit alcohol dehydrogenase family)